MLVQKYIRTFSKDYIRSWFYTNLEKYKLIAIAMHCTCCGCSKYKTNKNIFLAFFSCNFYVNTKWNSLPIFQILIFFWRQICCFQKCIRSTFSSILNHAKIKSSVMDFQVAKPTTRTWFHTQISQSSILVKTLFV